MTSLSVNVINFRGIAYHHKLLKILEMPLIPTSDGMPCLHECDGRRRIIDQFDSSSDAYEDPFAIEEVVMGEILVMPELL